VSFVFWVDNIFILYAIILNKDTTGGKIMEEMKEINWQEEIRRVVEELVRNKKREKLLAEAKEIRKEMKISVSSAELIREDRDAR